MNKPEVSLNRFALAVAQAVMPEDMIAYLTARRWKPVECRVDGLIAYRSPDGGTGVTFPAPGIYEGDGLAMLYGLGWVALSESRDVSYDLALVKFAAEVAASRGRAAEVYRVLDEFMPSRPVPVSGANGPAAPTNELAGTGS